MSAETNEELTPLRKAASSYALAQDELAQCNAEKAARYASAVKRMRTDLGNVEIKPELLFQYGYDERQENEAIRQAMNRLSLAQRTYAALGGKPEAMPQGRQTEIYLKVASQYNLTLDEMNNPDSIKVKEPQKRQESSSQENISKKEENKKTEPAKVQIPAEDKSREFAKTPPQPENTFPATSPSSTPSGSGIEEDDNRKSGSIWSSGTNGTVASDYTRTYTSYSGHDMVAIFEIPLTKGSITHVVGELQTISYSMYNEKMPVRVLGDMNMKSVVFGNRTIAGSMVFTVFDRHWAHKMMDRYLAAVGSNAHILTDELPPINITISMSSEYGDKSRLAIYGVTFVSEGQTMSINDMYTENTFQYMAKDLDYLTTCVDRNASSREVMTDDKMPRQSSNLPADETPVDTPDEDVPKKTDSPAEESRVLDYSYAFGRSEKDYVQGRSTYMAQADKKYSDLKKDVKKKYNDGELTKVQRDLYYDKIKKAWKDARKDADAYYKNSKKEGA